MNARSFAVLSLVATALAAACAVTERSELEPEAPPAPPPSTPDFTSPTGCSCSDDGKGVVCDGAVTACGPDQRCLDGTCVLSGCGQAKVKQSTEGCTFYTVVPDVVAGQQGCYALFLTNTTPRPLNVTLRTNGDTIDGKDFIYVPEATDGGVRYEPLPTGQIPPNGLAIAFVVGPPDRTPDGYRPCPAPPAFKRDESIPRSMGYSPAIVLETSEPVVASDIYPYGGADSYVTGASILLPINAWGTSYVSAQPPFPRLEGNPVTDGYERAKPYIDLIAKEAGTIVTITPKASSLAGGDILLPTPIGGSVTLELGLEQTYHLVQTTDLNGMVMKSNKPFLAISGTRCWGSPCDAAHQQLPAVPTLGWEYAAVGHRDRFLGMEPVDAGFCAPVVGEPHPFQLVGVVDGTQLVYEPSAPPDAPTTLDAGASVNFDSPHAFVVRSQDKEHPFLLAEIMSSSTTVDPCGRHGVPGDPEFTLAVPTAQYLTTYLFFTDPTYPTTHLSVVRQRDATGAFAPVHVDCLGEIASWSPLGDQYEYARVDLVTDGVGQGGCANGRHEMKSAAPFAVTVWGWGKESLGETQCTSYAFPASRGVRPVNPAEVQ